MLNDLISLKKANCESMVVAIEFLLKYIRNHPSCVTNECMCEVKTHLDIRLTCSILDIILHLNDEIYNLGQDFKGISEHYLVPKEIFET